MELRFFVILLFVCILVIISPAMLSNHIQITLKESNSIKEPLNSFDVGIQTDEIFEPAVTDSLKIPNVERDAKLAAGYKLYPGVGWVHPDDLGIQNPIYVDNPNNPDELILDIDSMIQVQKILDKCDYVQKLESGEIPAKNPDGSFNVVTSELRFYNNGTYYIDSNECKWVDSFEAITYICFEANPMEQNWYSGPTYFDNGTHRLDVQQCEWIENEN